MRSISLLFIFFVSFALQSCFVTRCTIGDGPVGRKGQTDVYSKARRFYLLGGLLPLGLGQPAVPQNGNCQVKTYFGGVDVFVSFITFGIITSRSTKILVYETDNPRRPENRNNPNPNRDNPDTKPNNSTDPKPAPAPVPNEAPAPEKEKKKFKLKNPFKKSA